MLRIDCNYCHQHLSAYHDCELADDQASAVASHLAECAECAEELRSFAMLGMVFSSSELPPSPTGLWLRIEKRLSDSPEPLSAEKRRTQGLLHRPSFAAGLLSLAAALLLLIGAGLWYGGEPREVQTTKHSAAGLGDHSSGDSTAHMAEFAGVMDSYLRTLSSDPDQAERMLLAKYSGQSVAPENAVQLVGYRPIVADGLPDGYSLASTSILKMPCCTCVKAVCHRSDGSVLVIFEHSDAVPRDDVAAWFGKRTSSMAMCGDKECCLVDLDSSIAATWQQGQRAVTAVGVRDRAEVERLVNWLEERKGES